MSKDRAKHKLCRQIGSCIWGKAKCPSVKRPYPAGSAKGRPRKMSTFGELLVEKQKLKAHYAITEKQLKLAYLRAKKGVGMTNEKLIKALETRLDSVVYRSGLAATIFAAKQFVTHRHILVDGQIVDKPSYQVKPGQVVAVKVEKSPAIANIAKLVNCSVPPYLDVDKEGCKATLVREPLPSEIPVNVEVRRVVEFYAK